MAHFAKLGTGNIIETVEVVSNDIALTEQAGVDFLNNLIQHKRCLETDFLQWIILEKTLLVLDSNMTKQEMLSYHLNLLTLGY
jgi:hypothetical protein